MQVHIQMHATCANDECGRASDDARWLRSRGPGVSCCIFHLGNPFSRFSVATGARACKSNARCPLVNLRVNTHRRDNLRSRQVHFCPPLPRPVLRLFFFSLSISYPSVESVFSDRRYGPECPGRRSSSGLLVKPHRSLQCTSICR